jgi:hypothetical protein
MSIGIGREKMREEDGEGQICGDVGEEKMENE